MPYFKSKYTIGIGEVLWDILPEGRKIGGAPANFAYHASQFGLDSIVISAIGKDNYGRELAAGLTEMKLKAFLPIVEFPTGTVSISVDTDGIPSYDIRQNSAWDNIPFTNELENIARNTCAVCFGSLAQRNRTSMNTIHRFLDTMPHDENILKIFDINLRQSFYSKDVVNKSLNKCNIVKMNDDEIRIVRDLLKYEEQDFKDLCEKIRKDYNLKILILTCGINGSYVFSNEGISYESTPKVEVADTVGAGDSFTAAFISSLLHGKNIREAHKNGVKVSAYVCGCHGAMPTLPENISDLLR